MSDVTSYELAVTLLRVAVGLTIAAHGYGKFFLGGRLPGTAGWFESIGMRPGWLHARLAGATEVGAGALLAIGFITPVAGAAIVSLMVVAAWTVHRKDGFFIVGNGWEYNLILAVSAITVAGLPAATPSVDAAVRLDLDGATGLAIAGLGGALAAIAHLATFYRPPAPAPAE